MVRAHEAIPHVVVEAVVAAHKAVVHVVVRGGVVPAEKPVAHEAAREDFKAAVAQHIHHRHVKQPRQRRERMQRQHEHDERKDARLDHRLQRMKRERRPRRGIAAEVMHAMEKREQRARVHEPVRPVKPGVVRQDERARREREIAPAARRDVKIKARPAELHHHVHAHARERENGEAREAVENLPPQLTRRGRLRLNLWRPPPAPHAEEKKRPAREDEVAEQMIDKLEGENAAQNVEAERMRKHGGKISSNAGAARCLSAGYGATLTR